MANDGSKFPIFTIPKGKKRSCDSHLRFNTVKKKQYHTYYNYLQYNNITITTNIPIIITTAITKTTTITITL